MVKKKVGFFSGELAGVGVWVWVVVCVLVLGALGYFVLVYEDGKDFDTKDYNCLKIVKAISFDYSSAYRCTSDDGTIFSIKMTSGVSNIDLDAIAFYEGDNFLYESDRVLEGGQSGTYRFDKRARSVTIVPVINSNGERKYCGGGETVSLGEC